jgi:hypothetical protein
MHPAPREQKPPVPTTVTILAVLVAVALIAGAFLLGRQLGTPPPPAPSESATALDLPGQLGGFQLAATEAPTLPPVVGKELVRANYTDGTDRVLLAFSRPETDVEEFLGNAGITNLTQQAEGSGDVSATMCGTSSDTGFPACGRIVDGTGRLLVGVTEVAAQELAGLLDQLPQ